MLINDDSIWKALADPTRRQILETLARESVTTGAIVDRFSPGLVRTAVMKHLDVLEAASLIRVERVGRTRQNHLERTPLAGVAGWLEKRVHGHEANLSRLKALAESGAKSNQRSKS